MRVAVLSLCASRKTTTLFQGSGRHIIYICVRALFAEEHTRGASEDDGLAPGHAELFVTVSFCAYQSCACHLLAVGHQCILDGFSKAVVSHVDFCHSRFVFILMIQMRYPEIFFVSHFVDGPAFFECFEFCVI